MTIIRQTYDILPQEAIKGVTYVLDISTEILRRVLCLFAESPRSTPGEAQLCRWTANIKTPRPIIRYVNA